MYQVSDFTKSSYRVKEVAEFLGVSTKTIRRYDEEGKLHMHRTEGNHRIILREDLLCLLEEKGLLYDDSVMQKKDVIYARVSSHDQKRSGDLDRQIVFLIEHTAGLQHPVILKEVGSGLNDGRVQLQKLLCMVCQGEVRNVYITYKDRLTRFGYRYLETIFALHGVSIIVVKDREVEKQVYEELVEDMLSLLASFSGKLYGLRGKKLKKEGTEHEPKRNGEKVYKRRI